MKKFYIIFLLTMLGRVGQAQIIPNYFFRNWDLSFFNPAALTQSGGLKGNMQYSKTALENVNISNSGLMQLHTDIQNKHGVGLTLQNYRSGILLGTGLGIGYGYKIKLSEKEFLSAGTRFNYFKYNINRAGVVNADVSDPVLFGDIYQQNSLLISVGLLYELDNFQIALTGPEMVPLQRDNHYKRNFNIYIGYTIDLDEIKLRPNIYYENLIVLGDRYEAGVFTTIKKIASLEAAFTSESALRIKAGLSFKSIDLAYGYATGAATNIENQVGHHIYLGYNFGNVFVKFKEVQSNLDKNYKY